MAKQTFVADAILTAAQMNALQSNDFNQTVSAKTASYTLVAADAGTRITMNNASATTITVNTSLFAAGDTLFIGPNLGAGTCTITAGTATVSTSGSLALAQNGGGTLYFTSAGVATFFSGAAGGHVYGVATGGTSSTITVSGVGAGTYTLLTFTGDGTLTVTTAGAFDYVVVGGGGGGGTNGRGGGSGGFVPQGTISLTANQAITVMAGRTGTNVLNARSNTFSQINTFVAGTGGGDGGDPTGATGFFTGGSGGNFDVNGVAGADISVFLGQAATTTFKAGGGAGGSSTGTAKTGGSGGGGNGGRTGSVEGVAGTANSGGGGGGGAAGSGNSTGGSGIVYVRFKI
jgi:hypothetical protein